MYIYNFDENTKEYLSIGVAEADPEETKNKGEFVPLIPANATLKEIPSYNQENQIPVFENDNWVVKSDYRKNYYKVDENLNVLNIDTIGEQEGIIVDKETGDLIKENPEMYKIVDDSVVKKSDEEYQQEQQQKEAERIAMLNLTRGDVFRGLLIAKGITKDQIAQMIEAMPTSTQEENVKKELAKIDFEDALNFYRGNSLIDTIGLALGISKQQLDEFFETNDYTKLIGGENE